MGLWGLLSPWPLGSFCGAWNACSLCLQTLGGTRKQRCVCSVLGEQVCLRRVGRGWVPVIVREVTLQGCPSLSPFPPSPIHPTPFAFSAAAQTPLGPCQFLHALCPLLRQGRLDLSCTECADAQPGTRSVLNMCTGQILNG